MRDGRSGERGMGGSGDGSETGPVTKKKETNRRPVSVPASPRTTGIKRGETIVNDTT